MIESKLVRRLFNYKNGMLTYDKKKFGIVIEKDGIYKIKIDGVSYFEHELIDLYFKK